MVLVPHYNEGNDAKEWEGCEFGPFINSQEVDP